MHCKNIDSLYQTSNFLLEWHAICLRDCITSTFSVQRCRSLEVFSYPICMSINTEMINVQLKILDSQMIDIRMPLGLYISQCVMVHAGKPTSANSSLDFQLHILRRWKTTQTQTWMVEYVLKCVDTLCMNMSPIYNRVDCQSCQIGLHVMRSTTSQNSWNAIETHFEHKLCYGARE